MRAVDEIKEETKKEVEFTPLNSTSCTPKRVQLRQKQVYRINSRNFKRLNIFKNIVLGILAGVILQLTVELSINFWYQWITYYIYVIGLTAYTLTRLDKWINYMAGGSYE